MALEAPRIMKEPAVPAKPVVVRKQEGGGGGGGGGRVPPARVEVDSKFGLTFLYLHLLSSLLQTGFFSGCFLALCRIYSKYVLMDFFWKKKYLPSS